MVHFLFEITSWSINNPDGLRDDVYTLCKNECYLLKCYSERQYQSACAFYNGVIVAKKVTKTNSIFSFED